MVNAYEITDRGFVDRRSGQELPIEPESWDAVKALFGFKPLEQDRYESKKRSLTQRRSLIGRSATRVGQGIATAIETGDHEKAKSLLNDARQFDRAHPDRPILPGLSSLIRQRERARRIAQATGLPLGFSPRDMRGAEQVQY